MISPKAPSQPRRKVPAKAAVADSSDLRRWMPAIAAGAVLAAVLVAGLAGRDSSDAAPSSTAVATTSIAGATTSTTAAEVVIETDPAIPKTHLTSTLRVGSAGDDVKVVQQRLTDLGFAPGPVDGQFGGTTQQSVWAFEKLILKTPRAQAIGKVTDEMWQTMQDKLTISPERPTGAGTTHVEIYVPQQVLIVFTDDTPKMIAHVATGDQNADGTPAHWCDTLTYDTDASGNALAEPVTKQECADAKTPGGMFKIQRFASGNHISPLGGMFNPVYFNYGIAIHGAHGVPLAPASHGCVRINETLAKTFPTLVKKGDMVYVWGQDGKQPEQYTKNESLPSFNQPDPNATTTTSSTTTTTTIAPTTTTTAATTTVKATTTTAPKATTTSKPAATTVAPTTAAPVTAAATTTVPAAPQSATTTVPPQ
ncbi:MAG: L,D-transpeptidase family protein [Ilumatobacteraceae bacterium]